MLICEGFKMFRGTMRITPVTEKIKSFEVNGTWLYKPEYDCWYCNGRSFTADICVVVEDKGEWIPVSERLPDTNDTIEAYSSAFGAFDAWYEAEKNEWYTRGGYIKNVTHWRIPESPKE